MKRRELERRLRQAGWVMTRRGRRHNVWSRGESEIAVPRHAEINEITAWAILKMAIGEQP